MFCPKQLLSRFSLTRWTRHILVLFAAVLVSCGGDVFVDSKDTPKINQYVYTVPDGLELLRVSNGNIYVELGESIRFGIGVSVNGTFNLTDSLQNYFSSMLWNIDGEFFNIDKVRYTFQSSGIKKGYLETVDWFGDTLRNEFSIYVNTPSQVSITFPYDGYNQAEPDNEEGLPLRWNVSGIDSWEKAQCEVFVSKDRDSVWSSSLGKINCQDEVLLEGTLAEDSAASLYWAVAARIESENGQIYDDSTEITHFWTKRFGQDSSVIKIPLVYEDFRYGGPIRTKIKFVDSKGDTLQVLENTLAATTLKAMVLPQSGLKIIFEEEIRREYAYPELTVDVPSRSVIELDTVRFKDKIAPQLEPIKSQFGLTEGVFFYLYDDGAGTGPSRIGVFLNGDSLKYSYVEPYLQFYPQCDRDRVCKLKIQGDDYSKNELPNHYWLINYRQDHYEIVGPISEENP